MKASLALTIFLVTSAACSVWEPLGDSGTTILSDMKCSPLLDMPAVPDMAVPCPAAKGLTGDNLLCVDFANPQTTLADLMAKGWKFDAGMSGNCGGWQIANNLLQVSNFSTLNGACGLTLQPITAAQIQKYSRLTLSIQQRIDLNDPQQKAQIFFNDGTDTQNLMWQSSGKKYVPRQQTIITIDAAELPTLLRSGGFKWFFQISSQLPIPLNGWQFESIAVNASP